MASPALADSPIATQTAEGLLRQADQMLETARADFRVGALASAEMTTWRALTKAAQAIDRSADASDRKRPLAERATQRLQQARTALREARQFAPAAQAGDDDAVRRIAQGHVTPVDLDQAPDAVTTIDRYLAYTTGQMTPIAAGAPQAAAAMDLLAEIALGRAKTTQLPVPTAISLRRAAVAGRPGDARLAARLDRSLAAAGLTQRPGPTRPYAEEVSAHRVVTADPSPPRTRDTPGQPEITRLTPQQFAAISRPTTWQRRDAGLGPQASASSSATPARRAIDKQQSVATERGAETTTPEGIQWPGPSNVSWPRPTTSAGDDEESETPSTLAKFTAKVKSIASLSAWRKPSGNAAAGESAPAIRAVTPPSPQQVSPPRQTDAAPWYGRFQPGKSPGSAAEASEQPPQISARERSGWKAWWR